MTSGRWKLGSLEFVLPGCEIPMGELLKYERIENSAAASRCIHRCLANPLWAPKLLEICRSDTLGLGHPLSPLGAMAQNNALRDLERALRDGRLILLRRKAEAFGDGGVEEGGQSVPTPRALAAAARAAGARGNGRATGGDTGRGNQGLDASSQLTWIDIQLVDQDNRPIPGEKYQLKLTDGSTREGILDGEGRVRVTDIPPGSCQVCFPEFDGGEWRAA
jgi:hypothetical protein